MIYRTLGRTGLKVSQLGFGAMRLPMTEVDGKKVVDRELSTPMIHRAFEAGLNYIDTAVGYCDEDSQRAVGAALKGWRDKIVVSTKNHYYGEDESEWWAHLEHSLERLAVDYIDIYNHHGINWERYENNVEPRVSKWMLKAKDQGLIRHICTSFHDSNEALMKLVDTGYVESITLQYNLLYRDLEEGIAYAKENNVGVVVMGPVAGGRLAGPSDVLTGLVPGIERVPELALRFVLSNPNVTVALSGMGTMQMVEENTAIAADAISLTADERVKHRDARPAAGGNGEALLHGLQVLPTVPPGGQYPPHLRAVQPGQSLRAVDRGEGELRQVPRPALDWRQAGRRVYRMRRVRG